MKPDWEGFAKAIMENWQEHGDVEASDKFDLACKFNLLIEIDGGFDPERHTDTIGFAEKGDPWFKENWQ